MSFIYTNELTCAFYVWYSVGWSLQKSWNIFKCMRWYKLYECWFDSYLFPSLRTLAPRENTKIIFPNAMCLAISYKNIFNRDNRHNDNNEDAKNYSKHNSNDNDNGNEKVNDNCSEVSLNHCGMRNTSNKYYTTVAWHFNMVQLISLFFHLLCHLLQSCSFKR